MRSRPDPPVGGADRPRPPAGDRDRGSATAEFALVLPAVVLVLLALLLAASAALNQVTVADAARAGARAAALGETEQRIYSIAYDLAGSDATVTITHESGYVIVDVSRPVPGPLGLLDLRASANSWAVPEPGELP